MAAARESRTVLLVEDNELNRDMLSRRLERVGYRVLIATDGAEAMLRMRETAPAVVLMDMNLPVMDGWSACRAAREEPALAEIPIIALTAHATDADRAQALAAGCNDYATKPIDFPRLLEQIERLLR
jgi:CheY-like chemotaxis protein